MKRLAFFGGRPVVDLPLPVDAILLVNLLTE
jgi:hypothetical protein